MDDKLMIFGFFMIVGFAAAYALFTLATTQIGEKGRKNVLIFNVFQILSGFLFLFLALVSAGQESMNKPIDIIIFSIIGILFIVGGIFVSVRTLAEKEEELITQHMTNVKAYKGSLWNTYRRSSSISGYVNGKYTIIQIIGGKDQIWIQRIKESGQKEITVRRYAASNRVHSIIL